MVSRVLVGALSFLLCMTAYGAAFTLSRVKDGFKTETYQGLKVYRDTVDPIVLPQDSAFALKYTITNGIDKKSIPLKFTTPNDSLTPIGSDCRYKLAKKNSTCFIYFKVDPRVLFKSYPKNGSMNIKITAYDGILVSNNGTDTLKLNKIGLTKITPTASTLSLSRGKGTSFKALGTYSSNFSRADISYKGTPVDISNYVKWKTNVSSVTINNRTGLVTTDEKTVLGKTVITATLDPANGSTTSAQATLTVNPAKLDSISITPSNPSIFIGGTQNFTAQGAYSDKTKLDITKKVRWTTEKTAIASFNSAVGHEGQALGLSADSVKVTASLDGVEASTLLTVKPVELSRIEVISSDKTLEPDGSSSIRVGDKLTFTAQGYYSNNLTKPVPLTDVVTWEAPQSATFTKNVLKADAKDSVLVKASYQGKSGTAAVIISPADLESIKIVREDKSDVMSSPVNIGVQLLAMGHYSDQSTVNLTDSVNWRFEGDGVSSNKNKKGFVIGNKVSEIITVSAALGNVQSEGVDLSIGQAALTQITVQPKNNNNVTSIAKGSDLPLEAIATYSDGSKPDITDKVTWYPQGAVMSDGSARFVKGGVQPNLEVSASMLNGNSALPQLITSNTLSLSVGPAVIKSLQINGSETPADVSAPAGVPQVFTAKAVYTDGSISPTNLTDNELTWSTEGGATVDEKMFGQITGNSSDVGQRVIVRATLKDNSKITKTIGFHVAQPNLNSITITRADGKDLDTSPIGIPVQFKATGNYSDETSPDITNAVDWRAVGEGVTTSTAAHGLIGGNKVGSKIEITAALQNKKSATTTLTITAPVLTEIKITPSADSVAAGESLSFTAMGIYSDESTPVNITDKVTWEPVANLLNGVFDTRVLPGSYKVKATMREADGSSITSNEVSITVNTKAVKSLEISPNSATKPAGEEQLFQVKAIYTNGDKSDYLSGDEVTWSATSATVGQTTESGVMVKGNNLTNGNISATVKATYKKNTSISKSVTFTVEPAVVEEVRISPVEPGAIFAGQSMNYIVQVLYSNSDDKWMLLSNATLTTTPSDGAVVQGYNVKVALTQTPKTAYQVTASYGGKTSSVNLSVKPPVLVGLSLSPASAEIRTGESQQFKAIAKYKDTSDTLDITNMITSWQIPEGAAGNKSGSSYTVTGKEVNGQAQGQVMAEYTDSNNTRFTASAALTVKSSKVELKVTPALNFYGKVTNRTLTITNSSGAKAYGVKINSGWPAGITALDHESGECGDIAAGASCNISIKFDSEAFKTAGLKQVTFTSINADDKTVAFTSYAPWVTNGTVKALVSDTSKGVIYLGGQFSIVGKSTGGGGSIDKASAMPSNNLPKVSGDVRAVVSDDNGGWYIGGLFSDVGGVKRQNLAHIKSDGSVDSVFIPAVDQAVYALAKTSDGLFVGGAFTQVGTVSGETVSYTKTSNYLVKLDLSNGGIKAYYGQSLNGVVRALVLARNEVFIGGEFSLKSEPTGLSGNVFSGQRILKTSSTGEESILTRVPEMETDHPILSLVFVNDVLYLGGAFAYMKYSHWDNGPKFSNDCNRVASFKRDSNGTFNLTGWKPNITGTATTVNAIAVNPRFSDGQYNPVYVGGLFSSVDGVERFNIAFFNTTSGSSVPTLDATFLAAGADKKVTSLTLSNSSGASSPDTLYVGGAFSAINKERRKKMAAIRIQDGTVSADWSPAFNSDVLALASDNDSVYAGGNFTMIGLVRNRLAAMDVFSGMPTDLNLPIDSSIELGSEESQVAAMALHKDVLYVGGRFNSVGASNVQNLFAVDLIAKSRIVNWAPEPNAIVRAIALYPVGTASNKINANVIIGGDFTTPQKYLAIIKTDEKSSGWDIGPNGGVWALHYDPSPSHAMFGNPGVLSVGGVFDSVTGKGGTHFVQYDLKPSGTEGVLHPLTDLVKGGDVYAIARAGNTLYVSGSFTNINNSAQYHQIAPLNATTGTLLTESNIEMNPQRKDPGTPTVRALAISGDYVYFGGFFQQMNYVDTSYIASWNMTVPGHGGLGSWNPGSDGPIVALAVYENLIYIGGLFGTANGEYAPNFLAIPLPAK